MAYTWTYKTVYIRETTDGKTRWVKLDGVVARRSSTGTVTVKFTDFREITDTWRVSANPNEAIFSNGQRRE